MSQVSQRQRSPSPQSPEKVAQREKAAQAMKRRNQTQPSFFEKYAYHLVIGAFGFVCVYALLSILTRSSKKLTTAPVIDEEEIAAHNSLGSYLQGPNDFFKDWKFSDAKFIFNNHLTFKGKIQQCPESGVIIPESYNFREAQPECAQPIYFQGNCSSSYSIAAVSATSDRLCKSKNGEFQDQLSPQSPISCDDKNYKCGGGSVTRVLEVGKKQGFVSTSCLPYSGTEDAKNNCDALFSNCEKYKIHDYCVVSSEENIKREILNNGPVVAVIQVFKDFLVYKGGIYEVVEGSSKFQFGHAVKVIGWGKQDGVNYWIIENSWGDTWGLKGLAYIAVGQNQLQLEAYSVAPIVAVSTEKIGE
ncbi:unnamed protein product [Paramecium pentaurelia]|uniref:Peptidase C1A papain C-terminal domain-containing protein n=1 Tax=Paramecium pentaurelia TaxID=43138 RepID=A0A8S1TB61_9CILI|nr:unnamed protein product [Paramecium pentaurelia]